MEEFVVEKKIYDIIDNQIEKNMLSHAYLIETGDYDNIESFINTLGKKILCSSHATHTDGETCSICSLIDSNQCVDFKTIVPDGNNIKKEQLLNVKKMLKTTSSSFNRIYVIFEADKLNSSSANTILKFLEEPEQGIIAFLVTKNRYQVIDTLVSRCQILSLHSHYSMEQFSDTARFVEKITANANFYLDFKSILEEDMPDKNVAQSLLNDIEFFFHQVLLSKNGQDTRLEIPAAFEKIKKESIIKYISIIEEEKSKLIYNINYKLWLDHLLVRFLEVLD